MSALPSPYADIPPSQWRDRTQELVEQHPVSTEELVEVTLHAWESIFRSSIGGFVIGADLLPKPQIMGFFLHELIPLELARRHPEEWRGEKTSQDKDIVYIPEGRYSVEIKTSSHRRKIFGNRSYAQRAESSKKDKTGYYLAINFEPFSASGRQPSIVRVRFGWLDHGDWTGQAAATGQQANLAPEVEEGKLLQLFPKVK